MGAEDRVAGDSRKARTLITSALLAELGRRVAEYENAIDWNTTCLSCPAVLDSSYAETARREAAEARLAALELHLPAVLRALEAAATGAGYEAIARPYRDARDALSAGEEAGQ